MSTDTATAITWSNLPVPVQPRFDCDQLALIFGTCLLDAVFIVDCETGTLVAANQRLVEILRREVADLEDVEMRFERFVHPEDRGLFRTWLGEASVEPCKQFQIRLLQSSGESAAVEVVLRNIRWQRREYHLGFVRECGERHRRELHLRSEAEVQKQRAVKALKSSLRMYELNEKIKSTLVLTTKLLNAEDEEELFSEAVKVLTHEDGLNFRDATVLILQDGLLSTTYSTIAAEAKVYSLKDDNKYTRLIADGLLTVQAGETSGNELIVPLQSRGALLGIVEVLQHAREKALFDEHPPIREWQRDMLVQIGDIIALLLDNLRLNRELKRQSVIDSLTGARNRNFFMQRLTAEVQRAKRYNRPISLIFIDVDHFKEINDSFGHLQGDQVLRELGALFRRTLRTVDVLGRYGGDEFVLLLPETDIEMAQDTATKLVAAVREHAFANLDDPGQSIPVSISVGLASLQPGHDEERFLQAADAALYSAKKEGRNRVGVVAGETAEHLTVLCATELAPCSSSGTEADDVLPASRA